MGYLIYKNGSSANTKELISVLWGEKTTSKQYGSNLRNLIVDIKQTMQKLNIQNFWTENIAGFLEMKIINTNSRK